MGPLPFDLDLIRWLAESRTPLLTHVFQLATWLGEVEGYVLLLSLVYVTFDKRLAFRLAVLTAVAMSLNHLVKELVMNPRPFVAEGSHLAMWAVSPARAAELATEFSTPSGHAMSAGAFYVYLFMSVESRLVRTVAIALLLATGLSRPYLGVHYLEDVLIGWPLGAALALFSFRYAASIAATWRWLGYRGQIAFVGAVSLVLTLFTRRLAEGGPAEQPLAFLGYTGFLMGVVVAHPLELATSDFDPRSSPAWVKALRLALCVALVMGTLFALDVAFAALASDTSPAGYLLRYVRYAAAGAAGLLVAPLLFVRLGLAGRLHPGRLDRKRGAP